MTTTDKIRRDNRNLRAGLDADALARAAAALCVRLLDLPVYRDAQRLAAYVAVNGEIDPWPLIEKALDAGKQVYLPNLDRETLRFSPYFRAQKMRVNRYRLPEPDVGDEQMLEPRELDLVIAPLVAFDAARNRVGMGGGFYDRSFAFRREPGCDRPVLVGVAHEIQRVDALVPEPWDVRLDMVVTDQAVYR